MCLTAALTVLVQAAIRSAPGGMLTVFVVAGDPEDMSVTHRGTFSLGRWGGWKPSSLEDLQEVVHEWVLWAQNNPFI
jgi:hypothetical protein